MKHAPADGILDEFREVALLGALGAQEGAQSEVGFFRDLLIQDFHFGFLAAFDGTPGYLRGSRFLGNPYPELRRGRSLQNGRLRNDVGVP